ncbi:hydroxyisourate hydrolase [Kordiimonas marina]|uniref:hydroxyisourate hydrolase n=1 Tax=Kordiimonas marina TaxID=2872312 RepID=UPI001FF1883B|nr:hydroxyisourate hydrolase [Kordiimonas marina]MCJ9430589.1 hydroxyisourate hydrolase [Kordiimonas marina]
MGRLTTHVLDTASGRPGQMIAIKLYRLTETGMDLVRTATTNADGRVDGALLEGTDMVPGQYQLEFAAGDYFRARGIALTEPAFLDVVPVRFGIADAGAHYHVPLLISPYGYSTYRGS